MAEDYHPQAVLRQPVVVALDRLGGTAPRKEVLDFIEQNYDLTEADWEALEGDGVPRWEKNVDFIAYRMRGEFLKQSHEVDWGIWALTERGSRKAQDCEVGQFGRLQNDDCDGRRGGGLP